MSRWSEQLNNHPIHETLKWMNESVSKEFNDLDDEEVTEKRRFLKFTSKLNDMLQSIDGELVPFNQLDALNTALRHQNVASQLNVYAENGTVANLTAVNNQLTPQLNTLSALLSLSESVPAIAPIKNLEDLIDTSCNSLVKKKDNIETDLNELSTNIEEKEQLLKELSAHIAQKKTEVDTHITEWQNQFSSSQESRSQDFNKWRDDFTSDKTSEIEAILNKYKDTLDANKSNFIDELNTILSDGKNKHQSILELYQLTAGDSVGAGYMKNANAEKEQADNWRLISVGFITLTVIWLLFAYFTNTNQTFNILNVAEKHVSEKPDNTKDSENVELEVQTNNSSLKAHTEFPWFKLFLTFSLSGILLWGSAYAAQQSTKHRKNEKRTRWFALEIKAIDPFISSMPPAQQSELKRQLSERIFGQPANDDNAKVIDEHILKVVTDAIGGVISKMQK